MNVLRVLRERWAQASLEYDLKHGLRPYGRTVVGERGNVVAAAMPVEATVSARIIRADGSVEDLGEISRSERTVSAEQLARLDAVAQRRARRGKG